MDIRGIDHPLRLLIVDDSEDDARLLLKHLDREGVSVESVRVDTEDAMRAALRAQRWDAVISDYAMPLFSVTAARALLTEAGLDLPFIIVSGTIGEETAVIALKAGAHDFMTKGQLSRLIPAIDREMRDAEERRRLRATENALSDTKERMRFALEAAGVGTWEWDLAAGTVAWSDMMERLHGMNAGTFRGTFDAFVEAVHPSDHQRVRGGRERLITTATNSSLEYRVTWPDGSLHWITSVGRAFPDDAGQPIRAAGIAIDVTGQKKLEEQLLQSQKMESVGTLAGGIAHDFNNLLTIIAGYCQLLADDPTVEARIVADLQEIRHAAEKASGLTAQLLAFSRKQLLAPRTVSLNDVVTNVGTMLRRLIEESVHLEFVLAPNLANVTVDPGQIEQVLVNLVVNARDAMPEGGTLTIETANLTLDESYANDHVGVTPGSHVMLSVSDTGSGMPPEIQTHIFEPFFTTKPMGRGTGLGLATVYGIVKQSGGHIFVYSEPGMGATFKLYFPVAARGDIGDAATSKAVSTDLNGTETILVVEDDERLRLLNERILKGYGYRVLVATDANQAKRICTDHAGPIHVLITDVIMPGGSGRTIGDWMVEQRPGTKVIYMSGYTDTAIARHGVLEPGMQFLQKPFSPAALGRKVREALS